MPTTLQQQLREVLRLTGEDPEELDCYYQDHAGVVDAWWHEELRGYYPSAPVPAGNRDAVPPIVHCRVDELPAHQFDPGFGQTAGSPTICFSPHYIDIRERYDGSERFIAIPRQAEELGQIIPWPGGGG